MEREVRGTARRLAEEYPLAAADIEQHAMAPHVVDLQRFRGTLRLGGGQAHGLPGLYITDSSIFPTSLGVNPQLTTMAVATRLGQRIAQAG